MRPHLLWLAASLAAMPAAVHGQGARAPAGAAATGAVVVVSPEQAVAAALAGSPALRGADASRQAVRGDALQAPLRPNPEATFLGEGFGGLGGSGELRGARGLETTLGVVQRVELGGKRAARIGLADRSLDVAGLEFEAARLDLARDAVAALAEAVAAARTVGVEQDRVRLAAETLRVARGRVEAGKEPLLQVRRAEVARATAEVAAERARREAEVALRNLAVLLGAPRAELAPRQAWFDDVGPLARMAANPDLARLDAAVAQQRANLSLQRANAVPDVTVSGNVRRYEANRGETAFVASLGIPVPISDRNQGGIARAQAELLRAEAEADRGRLALAAALTSAERRAELAWRSVQDLRRVALPAAEQAANFAAGGFAEGKFGFLEVLDAQRALSDARALLNDALREFHARRAEAERLRGHVPGVPPQTPGVSPAGGAR